MCWRTNQDNSKSMLDRYMIKLVIIQRSDHLGLGINVRGDEDWREKKSRKNCLRDLERKLLIAYRDTDLSGLTIVILDAFKMLRHVQK
ncbi:CLUMA_CG001453, isoform A [Clunio marinus]|uniref:CLUMA_CG001453, isoform A n=1 Tax=Clunio marinus TaxID=568069 RepID=A0A1J1HJS3_9DIPT|nr:CLUMA_CG001453, isoform A [Clunio marinus]